MKVRGREETRTRKQSKTGQTRTATKPSAFVLMMGILCFRTGNTGRQNRKMTFAPSEDGANTVLKLLPETENSAIWENSGFRSNQPAMAKSISSCAFFSAVSMSVPLMMLVMALPMLVRTV